MNSLSNPSADRSAPSSSSPPSGNRASASSGAHSSQDRSSQDRSSQDRSSQDRSSQNRSSQAHSSHGRPSERRSSGSPSSSAPSSSGRSSSRGASDAVDGPERARTIIQELRQKDVSQVPAREHPSAKKMDRDEVEDLLVQFVAESLAHAHLSAQIDEPTRQSVETMATAWEDAARTIIEAVRRVDREDPPTSFWQMQKR